jgi:hypothetical protein
MVDEVDLLLLLLEDGLDRVVVVAAARQLLLGASGRVGVGWCRKSGTLPLLHLSHLRLCPTLSHESLFPSPLSTIVHHSFACASGKTKRNRSCWYCIIIILIIIILSIVFIITIFYFYISFTFMLCNLSRKRQAKSKHVQLIMEARHKRQQRASFLPQRGSLLPHLLSAVCILCPPVVI